MKPGPELVTELLRLPPDARILAFERQPDRVYETLIDVAKSPRYSMNLRWKAVTVSALLEREKAVPELVELSSSADWYIRNASLVSLAEVSPKTSRQVARKLLKDPALVVRSAAIDVLAKNLSEEERILLWKELESAHNRRGKHSLWIRGQITSALAEQAQIEEYARFSKLLSEPDEAVQKASMKGLEKLTGLQVARHATSHRGAVRLWKAYVSRQPSLAPR